MTVAGLIPSKKRYTTEQAIARELPKWPQSSEAAKWGNLVHLY